VRKAAILLACVLGAVVMAGCGGGGGDGGALSKEDYEAAMQSLQTDLEASADELQQAFSDPSDIDAMSDGLSQTADLMSDASQSLDEIEPPEDVAEAHQAMVDQSASAADRLTEFADTVANASLADLQDTLSEFQNFEEFGALEQAVKDIEAAGYDIGGS
jgi:uncharacterized membrane protein